MGIAGKIRKKRQAVIGKKYNLNHSVILYKEDQNLKNKEDRDLLWKLPVSDTSCSNAGLLGLHTVKV